MPRGFGCRIITNIVHNVFGSESGIKDSYRTSAGLKEAGIKTGYY